MHRQYTTEYDVFLVLVVPVLLAILILLLVGWMVTSARSLSRHLMVPLVTLTMWLVFELVSREYPRRPLSPPSHPNT